MPNSFIAIVRDPNYDDEQKIALLEEGIKKSRSTLEEKGEAGQSILHEACFNGGLILFKWLVEKQPSLLYEKTKYGGSPLFYAADYGNKVITEYLLQLDITLAKANNNMGYTPLFFVAQNGNVEVLKLIQQARGDWVFKLTPDGTKEVGLKKILYHLFESPHLAMLKYLITELHCEEILHQPNGAGEYPLALTARHGYLENVKYLVEEGKVDVNQPQKDEWGSTALHFAAWHGHLHIVKYLVDHNANIYFSNKTGYLAFHYTVYKMQVEVVEFFLKMGVNINHPTANSSGNTLVHLAAKNNKLAYLRFFIENCKASYAPNKKGIYPLFDAAQNGHLLVVEYFIEVLRVDVNQQQNNEEGESALHIATSNNHLHIVQYLLAHQAKLNEPSKQGFYPLFFATRAGHLSMVKYLVEELHVDVNQQQKDKSGVLAIHAAVYMGHFKILQQLVAYGASYSDLTKNGFSTLHVAAESGQIEIADWLIKQGINVNLITQNIWGLTPLFSAIVGGQLKFLQWLIDNHQVDYQKPSKMGNYPLHVATTHGHLPIVKYLIEEKGVSPEQQTVNTAELPWQIAFDNEQIDLILFFYKSSLLETTELKKFFRSAIRLTDKLTLISCIMAHADKLEETVIFLKDLLTEENLLTTEFMERFSPSFLELAKYQCQFMNVNHCDYTIVMSVVQAAKQLQYFVRISKDFILPALGIVLTDEILRWFLPDKKEFKKITPKMILTAKLPHQTDTIITKQDIESKIACQIRFFNRLTNPMGNRLKRKSTHDACSECDARQLI